LFFVFDILQKHCFALVTFLWRYVGTELLVSNENYLTLPHMPYSKLHSENACFICALSSARGRITLYACVSVVRNASATNSHWWQHYRICFSQPGMYVSRLFQTPWPLVCQRPPLFGEVRANFCGQMHVAWPAERVPTAVYLGYLHRSTYLSSK
jgi:hypothetical protein